jgi:hypothetical protein
MRSASPSWSRRFRPFVILIEMSFAPWGDRNGVRIGEQIGVRRSWIVDELGDGEAGTICLEALNYMGELVADAHSLYGTPEEHKTITIDLLEAQVLLETDVDPTLIEKWGW